MSAPAKSLAATPTRRSFLVSAAGASFAIAFGEAGAAAAELQSAAGDVRVNGWVRVGTDNIVTVYSPAAEMGQGVKTAMPLLVAEDMDLDWSLVKVEQAGFDPKRFGNPLFGGGMTTGASRTTRGYYQVLRLAGLQARQVLLLNAAQHWNVPVTDLSTVPHIVVHTETGRRLSYGQIAAFATVPEQLPTVTREQLKPLKEFRLIGKDMPRVDVPDKVAGKAKYGIDTQLEGMLYALVLRAPVQGEKPEKIDDAAAKAIRGVKAVVTLPQGVGVVAQTYWAARSARDALKVEWSNSAPARRYTSDAALLTYRDRARNMTDPGIEFVKVGDTDGALAGAVRVFEAEYGSQHVAHTCMEPMNCTAMVTGEKIELWAPSQSPSFAGAAAASAGFKPENTRINITLLGGGFGRRTESDYVLDAVLLAKAMAGVPVKVVWTREDDIKGDKFRPLVAQRLKAGLDADGRIVALQHRIVSESIYARAAPPLFQRAGGRDQPVCEGAEVITYQVPNRSLNYLREQRGIDAGFWRGVGPGYTKFAIETLMDEMATAAGVDPVAFRLRHLEQQPRAIAVISQAANMAAWSKRRGPGRALGIAYSDAWESHVAQVAEVSLDRATGRIRVHDVWCAVDPGLALQPRNIEAQMESSIVFGISAALGEKITIVDGVPQQSNFHDYSVLRMAQTPRIHVKVMSTDHSPGGVGEVGLPPIAPAIANAVFRLNAKRLRDLPFGAQVLKA